MALRGRGRRRGGDGLTTGIILGKEFLDCSDKPEAEPPRSFYTY